jgi:hypothetical protein
MGDGFIIVGVQDPNKMMSYVAGKIKVEGDKTAAKKKPAEKTHHQYANLLPMPNPSLLDEWNQSADRLNQYLNKNVNPYLESVPTALTGCGGGSSNQQGPLTTKLESDTGIVVTDPVVGATFAQPDAEIVSGIDSQPATDALPAFTPDTPPPSRTPDGGITPVIPEADSGITPVPQTIDGGITPIPQGPDSGAPDIYTPDALQDPPVKIPDSIPIQITGDRVQNFNIEPVSILLVGQGLKSIKNLNLYVAANPHLIDPKLPCVPGVFDLSKKDDGVTYRFDPNDDGNRMPVNMTDHSLTDNTGKVSLPAGSPAGGDGGTTQPIPTNCSGLVQPTDIPIPVPQGFYSTSDPAKKASDGVLNATLKITAPITDTGIYTYGHLYDYRIEVRIKAQ